MCEYLQYGFPLNMDYQLFTFSEDVVNYPSGMEKSDGVDKYFEDDELHISPLMARSKPDDSIRVIVDLSWPSHCSVNSCVLGNCFDFMEFQLEYPTIDNLVSKIKQIDHDSLMFKVDLQQVFATCILSWQIIKFYGYVGITRHMLM